MRRKNKEIETMELWSKTPMQKLGGLSIFSDKKVEWVAQKSFMFEGDWYAHFTNVKGMRFNWLIKLWARLNGLVT